VLCGIGGACYLYLNHISEEVGIFELKHLLILVGIANVGIVIIVIIYKILMKKKSELDYQNLINKMKEKAESKET